MVGELDKGATTINSGRARTSMRSVMTRNRMRGGGVWRVGTARCRGGRLVGGQTPGG
jgi:hypothetical protein